MLILLKLWPSSRATYLKAKYFVNVRGFLKLINIFFSILVTPFCPPPNSFDWYVRKLFRILVCGMFSPTCGKFVSRLNYFIYMLKKTSSWNKFWSRPILLRNIRILFIDFVARWLLHVIYVIHKMANLLKILKNLTESIKATFNFTGSYLTFNRNYHLAN